MTYRLRLCCRTPHRLTPQPGLRYDGGMTRTEQQKSVHWEFTTADGTLVVKTCRNSLGGFARLVREMDAEHGGFVSADTVGKL